MRKKVLLASHNLHKVQEFRQLLIPLQWDIYSLYDFPEYKPPAEGVDSFEKNAALKARHAAKALKMNTLADDSGLVVPALGGEPGVRSARYAGENATSSENVKKLLQAMEAFPEELRQAYFLCSLCFVFEDGQEEHATGSCEGSIVERPRGGQGFGYDVVFQKHGYHKTFGELAPEIKTSISHRARAVAALQPKLAAHVLN